MSIERLERKSGEVVWRVRWRDHAGGNRSKVVGRKADAVAFDAEVRRRKRTLELESMDGGKETLDEYVADTWAKSHMVHLAPNTQALYADTYDRHISPHLGSMPLREIRTEVISGWQADLVTAGVGAVTVKRTVILLGTILQRAAESGRIPSNPQRLVRKVRLPRRREVVPLSPASIEAMRAASSLRDATLISVLAYAGLRPVEALDLRWSQVKERTMVITASKTGARRSVRLLRPLAIDLAQWRSGSVPRSPEAFVFPGQDARRFSKHAYQSWRRRSFDTAAEAAGVPEATPYTLRHSFCSLLIAEGRSVIEVARQMGHGANLTLTTYGHVIDELSGGDRIDAEAEIGRARRVAVSDAASASDAGEKSALEVENDRPQKVKDSDLGTEDVPVSYLSADSGDDPDTFWA